MLLSAWTYNFSVHTKGNLAGPNDGEHTKLYYFGHGHAFLHSIWASKSLCKNDGNSAVRSTSRQDRAHVSKVLMVLILLCDIHLNPGPTLECQASSVEVMPDTGESAQVTLPLIASAPHAADLEEMLTQCQELAEQRHAGKRSASEIRVRTSDRVHTGELPRLIDILSRTGPGGYFGCGDRRGLSPSVE